MIGIRLKATTTTTYLHEVRDANSMYDSADVKEVFDVETDDQKKQTTEKRLIPFVVLIIDSTR